MDLISRQGDFIEETFSFLFIDNIQFLDAQSKSQLFRIIEEGDLIDYILVLGISNQFIKEFSFKIPLIISLPNLEERPLLERFQLINTFFAQEASYAKKDIHVSSNIMKILLSIQLDFNIRELHQIIKTALANTYARNINSEDEQLILVENDLNLPSKKLALRIVDTNPEIYFLLNDKEYFIYDRYEGYMDHFDKSNQEIDIQLEKQYDSLINQGINFDNLQTLTEHTIGKINDSQLSTHAISKDGSKNQLTKIINEDLVELVEQFLVSFYKEKKELFNTNVFYSVCLHLNSILFLNSIKHHVKKEQLTKIVKEYPDEYIAAGELCRLIHDRFSVDLSIEENAILAMFLIGGINTTKEISKTNPVVLYAFHGRGTASSLRDVTNTISKQNNAYAYDYDLNKEFDQATKEITSILKKIDRGAGVLVIYDMGSIRTILENIIKTNDINIRMLELPLTMIGIEAARKSANTDDIDEVYHEITSDLRRYNPFRNRRKLIITLCHTGEGGAVQLKNYIEQYSKLNYKIAALSISNKVELVREVIYLKKLYEIHTFVGTYDPKIFGIPFISIKSVFEVSKENLDQLLTFTPIYSSDINFDSIYTFLKDELKFTPISKLKDYLPNVIDKLDVYFDLGEEQTTGIFMHLAAMIERKLSGEQSSTNQDLSLLDTFSEDVKILQQLLKPLEKNFNILIDDNELVTILMILKKI